MKEDFGGEKTILFPGDLFPRPCWKNKAKKKRGLKMTTRKLVPRDEKTRLALTEYLNGKGGIREGIALRAENMKGLKELNAKRNLVQGGKKKKKAANLDLVERNTTKGEGRIEHRRRNCPLFLSERTYAAEKERALRQVPLKKGSFSAGLKEKENAVICGPWGFASEGEKLLMGKPRGGEENLL